MITSDVPIFSSGLFVERAGTRVPVGITLSVYAWFVGAIPLEPDLTIAAWEVALADQEARAGELIREVAEALSGAKPGNEVSFYIMAGGINRKLSMGGGHNAPGQRIVVIDFCEN